MRILIAEDDPVPRRLLESFLSKWGYDVVVTCDGRGKKERRDSGSGGWSG